MNETIFAVLYLAIPIVIVLALAELYWRVSWWWSMRRYTQLQRRRMQESIDVESD